METPILTIKGYFVEEFASKDPFQREPWDPRRPSKSVKPRWNPRGASGTSGRGTSMEIPGKIHRISTMGEKPWNKTLNKNDFQFQSSLNPIEPTMAVSWKIFPESKPIGHNCWRNYIKKVEADSKTKFSKEAGTHRHRTAWFHQEFIKQLCISHCTS